MPKRKSTANQNVSNSSSKAKNQQQSVRQQQKALDKAVISSFVDGSCVWNSILAGIVGLGNSKVDSVVGSASSAVNHQNCERLHSQLLAYIKGKILNDEDEKEIFEREEMERKKKLKYISQEENDNDDDETSSDSSDEENSSKDNDDDDSSEENEEQTTKLAMTSKIREKIKEVSYWNSEMERGKTEEFSNRFVSEIIQTIRNLQVTLDGYFMSAADPLLIVVAALFDVNIIHNYCGNDQIFKVLNPKRTVFLSSSLGHMMHVKNN